MTSKKKRKKLKKDKAGSPDYGTWEMLRHCHAPKVEEHDPDGGKRVIHRRNFTQCTLDRYFSKGIITKRQWSAGDRLKKTIRTAGLDSLAVVDLCNVPGGYKDHAWGIPLSERMAAARQEVRDFAGVLGTRSFNVLVALVQDNTDVLENCIAHTKAKERERSRVVGGMVGLVLDVVADRYHLPN